MIWCREKLPKLFRGRKKHLLCYVAKRKKVVAMSEKKEKKTFIF